MSVYEDTYRPLADKAAEKFGISKGLFADYISSNNPDWNPYQLTPTGAGGIASLTAEQSVNAYNPEVALNDAARILANKINSGTEVFGTTVRNATPNSDTTVVPKANSLFSLIAGMSNEKSTVIPQSEIDANKKIAANVASKESFFQQYMREFGAAVSSFYKTTGLSLLVGFIALIIIVGVVYKFVTK